MLEELFDIAILEDIHEPFDVVRQSNIHVLIKMHDLQIIH